MAKRHVVKTDPDLFNQVIVGVKTFDFRINDRDYKPGDIVIMRETKYTSKEMVNGNPLIYTGRTCKTIITYVLRGPRFSLNDGWCIFSHRLQDVTFKDESF